MEKRTKAKQKKVDEKIDRVKLISLSRKPISVNILALDQASKCGVAYQLVGEKAKVELWDLSIKNKESQGMKWLRFEAKLINFIKKNDIKIIAYELPAGRNINPIIHSSKLICIVEKACADLGLEYIEMATGSIKKFATGNGNAKKDLMIEFAKKLWGYEGEDDNEADALHILHYLKSKINYE
jgi:Holliday junction resolvasome RuvABC endonuclease subunit